ncbi:MAG: hypothetical protein R6U22_11140, partial [Desulfohalobiaceae bacterium]
VRQLGAQLHRVLLGAGGSTLWATDGMSQWEFEDTDIDFLDGDGTKLYVTVKNTLSDNLHPIPGTSIGACEKPSKPSRRRTT